ncbi:hypothetical protein BHM03_00021418 [Ensete ventricosum]|nr:hypothetical protein BHM03_00021418 [Ensete ventricosum]
MCRSTVGTVCTELYQAYGDMVYIKVPSCTERIGPLLDWYVSSIPSVSSGLALEDKAEGGTSVESSIPCSHGGRGLVVKGVEQVENTDANSKYQDKVEGQRPRNFIRPVLTSFSSR